jgi:methionyl-tRNA formyltransferase
MISHSLKIALCGIHQQGLDIAEFLASAGHPVSCLVTIDEDRAERNNASGWISYRNFSERSGIPLYEASTYALKHEGDCDFFKRESFDVIVLGGWQRLLPETVLGTLNFGAIGQHGSSEHLPRGRGRSPLNWSVIEGRERLVWNLFLIQPGVDDGPILDKEIFQINAWDNAQTLYYKVGIVVKHMLARTLDHIQAGTLTPINQSGEPTYYGSRKPEDGLIDWSSPLTDIYNLIRAVSRPYPGAFSTFFGSSLTIWNAQPFDAFLSVHGPRKPGEVVEVFDEMTFVVACVDGLLLVTDVDGYSPTVGDTLGSG